MGTRFEKYFKLVIEYSFYAFLLLLPWQTKLYLRPALSNFQEISLYMSQIPLIFFLLLTFIYKLKLRPDKTAVSPVFASLAIFQIFIVFSFFFAVDQYLAFYHYLLIIGGIALFYFLKEGGLPGEDSLYSRGKSLGVLLFSLFGQAVLGIWQFLNQQTFACKYLGLALHEAGILGTSVVESDSGRWLRAYGGFDHPNILGGVMALSLIVAAYILSRQKVVRTKGQVFVSLSLFLFYFFALLAMFFSFSRAAGLAFFVGIITAGVVIFREKDRWVFGRFLALVFFSIMMIVLIAVPYRDLIFVRSNPGVNRLEVKSLDERRLYFDQASSLLANNYWHGTGVGNYVSRLAFSDEGVRPYWDYQPVHNVFMLILCEAGIGALLSFLAFLFLLKKDRRTALFWPMWFALFILMLFDHWLFSLPFGLIFLFFVFGFI
jgi:hypothetical protein